MVTVTCINRQTRNSNRLFSSCPWQLAPRGRRDHPVGCGLPFKLLISLKLSLQIEGKGEIWKELQEKYEFDSCNDAVVVI